MFGRKQKTTNATETPSNSEQGAGNPRPIDAEPTKSQVKRATKTRLYWALFSSFLLLLAVIFLILVEIGDTQASGGYSSIYFININVANIIPVTIPNAVLINSIAQSLGIHDFYTVGLWGFCEGYDGQGTVSCSSPQTLYWFNPVEIIRSELLAGATIALPARINEILDLIRVVSHWMFGLFLTGACLNFVMIFLTPLSVFSRWATLPIMLLTFLAALVSTVATIIATVMFIIIRDTITSDTSLNIKASIGVEMFAFMWIAAGSSILAWLIQLCLTCCCASRRDVKRGKKKGSKKAWTEDAGEEPARRGIFGRRN